MKHTVGAVIVSVLLSSILMSGATVMAASAGPGSHSAKKSSLQTGVHKKSKAGKHKRKMSKLQKKKAIARAKAMHNAQKKEKRVAHMRDGLKKIAKHSKKAKPAKLANS